MSAPELRPPPAAETVFGARLPLAQRYAEILATDGIDHGLIGPREVPRLWDRHLLNCAAVAQAFPPVVSADATRLVDVGSGAGLPGLVLALCRPELRVQLVEPMQRRCQFLSATVAELGLVDQVEVVRGRADEPAVREAVGEAPWVTARAVAPLDRLARWCLPLLRPGGILLAMKGASAEAELTEHRNALTSAGAVAAKLEIYAIGETDDPGGLVRVVTVTRGDGRARERRARTQRGQTGRSGR